MGHSMGHSTGNIRRTRDGTLDRTFDGTLGGTLDGTFDGTLDGTFRSGDLQNDAELRIERVGRADLAWVTTITTYNTTSPPSQFISEPPA